MNRYSKTQISGQARRAKIAYLSDLRTAPSVYYAYELKASDRPPRLTRRYYEGNVRKTVRDDEGNPVKYTPKYADISDLGLLSIMGSIGVEDGDGYILFDVYEDRNGKVYIEGGNIDNFPDVKKAFDRAKKA